MDKQTFETMRAVEESHWWFRARRDLLLGVLESRVPPGGQVFDVGCGTGYFLEAAAARGYRVAGLDPEPMAVEGCHRRGLEGVRAAGIGELACFAGLDADAVTFFDVLEHLDDDLGALRAAYTVLRPGGSLVVSVPAYPWLWSWHDDYHHHRRRYLRDGLAAVIAAAGFTVESVGYFNSRLFPLALADRMLLRFRTPDPAATQDVPPPALNRFLERVFRSEAPRLLRTGERGYAWGLSLLAVAERPAA